MVFQNYALYPHLTVFENIAFPLRLRKHLSDDEIRAKVAGGRRHPRARPSTSTASPATCPAASASGWRWAGPSCARPTPSCSTSRCRNLDAKLRGQMRTEILRMQRRLGITTVYVTHDQTEAMTLGDRVALLRKGELQQVGTPAGPLRAAGQPVRRRLHRLAADELRARHGRRRPARAAVRHRSTLPADDARARSATAST